MANLVQNHIDDARRFQKYGDYNLALSSLQLAQQLDLDKEYVIEIQKLISYNHRKLGNYDMALLHINNAINHSINVEYNKQDQNEHAVCLMNKGIIYEECERYNNALECYLCAIELFVSLHGANPSEYGILINALITLGLFYYRQKNYEKAKGSLEYALNYFGANKENDRRYLAIVNTLKELQDKQI